MFTYWTLGWPFHHHKINSKKCHARLKKKITALPKSVWCLPWVHVLQQCTFPIPVSDNEQQYFWGVFAFWSLLWSNAIVHWQKRCEVQNKVMNLIWFPPPTSVSTCPYYIRFLMRFSVCTPETGLKMYVYVGRGNVVEGCLHLHPIFNG